ncbi:uncharacterized protein LOC128169864, partial [Crassostrea angulata]|uniref:uncharacterized protein LOC128169864 n=1 Tax=Magallana angulata TaxID=2784310 RepID=UPI0022B1D88C
NVALNQPAYQQYPVIPVEDTYDASNAVDGRKSDLSWDGGQCDWYRTYTADKLLGFSVYISNTTDRSQVMLCFNDYNFTKYTIPPVFTTNCYVHGQYVIYYNERLQGVVYPDSYYIFVRSDLCEVEVY